MKKFVPYLLAWGVAVLSVIGILRIGPPVAAQSPTAPPKSYRPYTLETEETLTYPGENGLGTQTRKSLRIQTMVRSDGSRLIQTIHPAGHKDIVLERADGLRVRALEHPARRIKTTRQSKTWVEEALTHRLSPELECRQSYSRGRPTQALETVIGRETLPGVPGLVIRLRAAQGEMQYLHSLELGCAEVGRIAVFKNKYGSDSSVLQLVSLQLGEPDPALFLTPPSEFEELPPSEYFPAFYQTIGGRVPLNAAQLAALKKQDADYLAQRPTVSH